MASSQKRLRHPYHLQQLYSSWRLKILKHAHTGTRVHHQHTSYPLIALLLLGTGAVLVQSTVATYATDSMISAVISGPVPTVAATIDTPADGDTFTATPISVTGTCPVDSYLELYRNNFPSGTAYCTNGGTYSIQTDLFAGSNALVVRDYNSAGQAGPDSPTHTVTYTPPVVPITPSVQGSGGTQQNGGTSGTPSSGTATTPPQATPETAPLTLNHDFTFQGFALNTPTSWDVAIAGGTAPYSISVAWGDGQTALYTSTNADTLTLTHTYTTPASDGVYTVLITASDAAGSQTVLQIVALATIVEGSAAGGVSTGTTVPPTFIESVAKTLGPLWSVYSGVSIGVLAFWLGELREFRLIRLKFPGATRKF